MAAELLAMNEEDRRIVIAAIATIMQPLDYLYDEEEEFPLMLNMENIREERVLVPRVEGYVERIVPSFSANEFQAHFRVLPETFQLILREIGRTLRRSGPRGNEMISPEKQLLLALWRLSTPDSYRSINQRFGVGKATSVRAVRRVVRAIANLRHKYVSWPTGERAEEIGRGFSRTSAFPGVIGAIDGTHINITAPKENPEAYVNRKGHHSMILQAVCDNAGVFTHCYVGHVGSVHDARVYRLSSLNNFAGDNSKYPNDMHLVGDAAYAIHPNLLTPYADNGHLTDRQKNYNFCHSSARMAIERAFGLLKGRWRSLLDKLAMKDLECIPYHIMACTVLHNICQLQGDILQVVAVRGQGDDGAPNPAREHDVGQAVAVAKRNAICRNLRMREV